MRTSTPAGSLDPDWIRRGLAQTDAMALRATLYQLTRDEALARLPLDAEPSLLGELPALTDPSALDQLRERALKWLLEHAGEQAPPPPSPAELTAMLPLCVGEPVPEEARALYLEELGIGDDPRALRWRRAAPAPAEGFHVAIIGAGMGGLCAAIRCRQAGIPFTVIEKNAGVGGTWFENTYPGARVDVPSHWYSYTFQVDHPWEHHFAPQEEIRRYLERCAELHDVGARIRFGEEVESARWDEDSAQWRIRTRRSDGRMRLLRANALISSVGMLNRPRWPDLPGLDDFRGDCFHTSRWDHGLDLRDQRVAVVGTGASALQLVPDLAPQAAHVSVFQRSPAWIFPVPGYRDRLAPELAWVLEHLPYLRHWLRLRVFSAFSDRACAFSEIDPDWSGADTVSEANEGVRQRCVEHLESRLGGDPELLRKCLPDYPPMAKRFVVDNGWFDALRRDDVSLVTEPIERIGTRGVHTRDGVEHPADVLILATGFHADRYLWPMHIEGREGVRLDEVWKRDGARAYLGITVPGFPNLFCLYGPNTNPRAGSVCTMHELQVRYAMEGIRMLLEGGHRSMDCRIEVHEAFNRRLDRALSSTIWTDRRQESYYRNADGRVTTNSPWKLLDYWRWTTRPDPADYVLR